MKIKVLFLVFALILTMIVPAHASASFPQEKIQTEEYYGKYVVSVKSSDTWNEVDSLNFGKNQTKLTIDIGKYLNGDTTIVKLAQNGGGSAYLDAVLLGNNPAQKVSDNNEKVLNKLSKEDLDITPVGEEGVILEFESQGNGILTVVGRIEPVVIGKEPLQFPMENTYKNKDEIEEFYSYTLDSNIGKVIVDGNMDEVMGKDPFIKEFRKTGSGHPFGDVYFWVMNDDENLYVTMDATVDNTYDGDKDYGKVFINSNEGIKEFKVSVPETEWGNTSFIYTDKVTYEHKVYEFEIPLSELGIIEGKIEIAFALYGTATAPPSVKFGNPDVAFDNQNYYLSVFDYSIYENYSYKSYICGEILDSNGNVISDRFPIYNKKEYYNRDNRTPTVSYDIANKNFLVVWAQSHGDAGSELMACTVKINDVDNPVIGEAFPVSGNKEDYTYEMEPDLTYGDNGQFLLVWSQYSGNYNHIYGRIIDSKNTFTTNSFTLTNNDYNYYSPKASYDSNKDAYIITWYIDQTYIVEAQVVNSSGIIIENGYINIAKNSRSPHVSLNNFDINMYQFLVTWHDNTDDLIKGQYIEISSELIPQKTGNTFLISSDDEYYYNSPVSYNDGNSNMLCVWIPSMEGKDSHATLQYIDKDGKHFGNAFYTNEYDGKPLDNLYYDSLISITGDNKGSILIAYNHKYRPTTDEYSPEDLGLDQSAEYTNSIGYRMFGEPQFDPYIKFSNTPYNITEDQELQTYVKLFNMANPQGIDITFEDSSGNMKAYVSNDTNIVKIGPTGEIFGINEGEANITVIYTPYFTYNEDGSLRFPDGILSSDTVKVTVAKKSEPFLRFDPSTYSVTVGKETTSSLWYFDGITTINVTKDENVIYSESDSNIAKIVTGGAIRGIASGTTTISAIYAVGEVSLTAPAATVNVTTPSPPTKPSSGSSSAPVKTPIGEILVDKRVIQTLYKEDVKVKNNIYTFTADMEGDNAKLRLDSSFYKELTKEFPNRSISFVWDRGTYTLPLSCGEVLDEIDSSTKRINILLEKIEDKKIKDAAKLSATNMGAEVISDLIDFCVFVEKSNKNVEINSLDFYAVRTINELNNIDQYISTAMKFVEDKEILTFAPSVFNRDLATIKYRGNGIFTIIENPQTFNDIGSHWAKMNIEKLASRNIAFGRQNKIFAPNDFITRAEFAVMITRALGITEEEGTNDFKDVSDEWFAEDISTAFEAELIKGRNDGKFYPSEKIQRKDMAVMINNALKFADNGVKISDIKKVLSMFNDSNIIDDYAKESTAVCANAGIIMGRDTQDFDPNENATRAEASAIIERMLRYLNFMN